MYQNINRINRKTNQYLNGKPNYNPKNHQIKKAPIKRLLEQNTVINMGDNYLTNLNVYPEAVEIVQNYLEETIQQIAQISTTQALNKNHRATIMPEDIRYAIQKIKKEGITI